ncbi:MAG: SIR2 family protein [Microthrixaceae bacterium]
MKSKMNSRAAGERQSFAKGHLFVVRADLTAFACEAVLVPTDDRFMIEKPWLKLVGLTQRGCLKAEPWRDGELARVGSRSDGRLVILGRVAALGGLSNDSTVAIAHAADVAERFIRLAAQELGNLQTVLERPTRIVLPFIGTGNGGLSDAAGQLIAPLIVRLRAVAEDTGIDVVLATVRELSWNAIQQVRRTSEFSDAWGLDDGLVGLARRLAEHARSRRLVLFMGAGVSADAGLPRWEELLKETARRLEMEQPEAEKLERLDPRDQARLLENRAGSRKAFLKVLESQLSHARFGLTHALLASLEVEAAVTTNFDRLYERACHIPRQPERRPKVLPYEVADDVRPWLLKLHGDLGRPDVVITRSDYLKLARDRGALFGILQALLVTKHLLFVGYGMADDDFHSLVDEINSAINSDKTTHLGTALVLHEPIWKDLWSNAVSIKQVGDGTFSENARTMQIFLDLVACLAVDGSTHLLERDFRGLLSSQEQELADQLREIHREVDNLPEGSAVRLALLESLRGLGLDSSPQLGWSHDEYFHAYWIEPGRVLAGEYPGSQDSKKAEAKIELLIDHGVRTIIDLTQTKDGLTPYGAILEEAAGRRGVEIQRISMPIPDMGILGSDGYDRIIRIIAEGKERGAVYFHCWGGIGRTATVAGCLLVDSGYTGEEALERIIELRALTKKADQKAPQTEEQIRVILDRALLP